jgi:hypothetical protein
MSIKTALTSINLINKTFNIIVKIRNKHALKKALDNPADTIANGGSVHKSWRTFEEVAKESERY